MKKLYPTPLVVLVFISLLFSLNSYGQLNTWLGATDDWNVAGNWSLNSVPASCSDSVSIPSGNPSITSVVTVGNVSIDAGATLTVNSNLNICGRWTGGTGSNAIVNGTGTVIFNGTAAQNISGTTQFNRVRVNNGNGVSLGAGASVSLSVSLSLQHGALNTSAGSLRLLSTAANNNSFIDDFTAGYDGTITGNITADRFVPVTGLAQHFISSPVNAPSFSQLNATGTNGLYVTPTGDCDESRLDPTSDVGTVFQYNDGYRPSGYCMIGNWQIRSTGNLDNGRGYSALLAGNSALSLTGAPNTGNISIDSLNNSGYPTVMTLQGSPHESGWNLVGNPYPSAIDLTISRNTDSFQNQVHIWQTSGPFSGTWQAIVINGNPGIVTIAPFQGFMVRVMPGSTGLHSYPFYQSERTKNTGITFYRTSSSNRLELEVDYNGLKDITTIGFNDEATTGFDELIDANKVAGAPNRPTLYSTLNDNTWYAINNLPSLNEVAQVPVGLLPGVNGTMVFTPHGIETFDPGTSIFLYDKKEATWHNLRQGPYTFTTSTSDTRGRFEIHFTPTATGLKDVSSEKELPVWSYDNNIFINFSQQSTVNADISIYNAMGQLICYEKFSKSFLYSKQVENAATGYFIIKVSNNSQQVVRRIFINNTK